MDEKVIASLESLRASGASPDPYAWASNQLIKEIMYEIICSEENDLDILPEWGV